MPLVSYTGLIDSLSIATLLAQAEKSLEEINSPDDMKKKILGITAELLQNVFHHCPCQTEKTTLFFIEKTEERFIITTSNLILENKTLSLTKQIENINACTTKQLTSHYRDLLKNGTLQGENAGLGLIDIRRKSGNAILFKFASADNTYALLTVNVLI